MIAPATKDKGLTTNARVVDSAIAEVHPDTAKVLVFVNQDTTTADKNEPVTSASSVVVTLTKQNGTWPSRRSIRHRPEQAIGSTRGEDV